MDELLKTIVEKAVAALPGAILDQTWAFGELTLTVEPARIVEVLTFLRDDPDWQFRLRSSTSPAPTIPSARSASTSSITCCRRSSNRRVRVKVATDEETPVASATAVVSGRRLVRARDLRPVRRAVRRPSRPAPHPHRLRLRRASAAQGFPDDRLRRGPLRRSGEAGALRAGAAHQEFRQFDFLSPWEGPPLPGDEKASEGSRQ